MSLWRNWAQTGPTDVAAFAHGAITASDAGLAIVAPAPAHPPAAVPAQVGFDDGCREDRAPSHFALPAPAQLYVLPTGGLAAERIGLILPTSLCRHAPIR